MSPAISRVLGCLADDDSVALADALDACPDPDERLADGESVLFHAVLSGRIGHVKSLLDRGADPNFRSAEPATDSLAPTPLDLAMQARFLMSWETYHPIALLLQQRGARDCEGQVDTPQRLKVMHSRATRWQSGRVGWVGRAYGWLSSILRRVRSGDRPEHAAFYEATDVKPE